MQVGGLDVAMDDAGLVRVVEAIADLRHQIEARVERERRLVLDQRREIDAVEQFHDDGEIAVRLVELVDGDDVRMIEAGRGAGFLREAGAQRLIVVQLADHLLDGDDAVEDGVVALVNHAHRSLADALDDGITAVDQVLFDEESAGKPGPSAHDTRSSAGRRPVASGLGGIVGIADRD